MRFAHVVSEEDIKTGLKCPIHFLESVHSTIVALRGMTCPDHFKKRSFPGLQSCPKGCHTGGLMKEASRSAGALGYLCPLLQSIPGHRT